MKRIACLFAAVAFAGLLPANAYDSACDAPAPPPRPNGQAVIAGTGNGRVVLLELKQS